MNGTTDHPEPEQPAHGRQVQEREQSHGNPRKTEETGRRRTEPKAPFIDKGGTSTGDGESGSAR